MARPFGRLAYPNGLRRPGVGSGLGSALPRLGSSQQQINPAEEYLPTVEQVDQAEQEIENEESLLTSILLFPERILGGQALKGLLAGEKERGFGDNLQRGFLNNPLFQVTDMLGITDLTKQVDFADVRESGAVDFLGLGGRGARVREGFGNFAFNFVGDVVTDPLGLMLTPFGKVPGATAKLTKEVAGVTVKKTLVESVQEGARAMAVFSVPFTNRGFHVQLPKNLDLHIATGLSKTAERLNQVPLVQSVAKTFNRTFLGAKTLTNSETGRVVSAAEQNLFMHGAAETSAEYGRNYVREPLEKANEIAQNFDRLLQRGDQEDILFVVNAVKELGVSKLDDHSSIRELLLTGPQYAKAQGRLRQLLLDETPEAATFRAYRKRAIMDGDEEAAALLRANYPDASMYLNSEFLEPSKRAQRFAAMGLEPKPGVDFRADTRQFGFDVTPDRALLLAQTESLSPPSNLIRPLGDPDRVKPAILADEVPSPERAVVAGAREQAVGALDRLREATGSDVINEIGSLVNTMNVVMREFGHKDMVEGIINMTTGPYFPRIVSQKTLDLVDKLFVDGINKKFPQAAKNLRDFFQKERKFTEMTAFEVNALAREVGINFTGGRPLKEFEESVQAGAHSFLARIFDGDSLEALKTAGADGKKAWEFFSGNPVSDFMRRIQGSKNIVERTQLGRSLVAKGSPMVLEDRVFQDLLENPEIMDTARQEWGRELVWAFTDDVGGVSSLRADQVMRAALGQDLAAKRMLTTRFLRDDIARQVSEGKVSLDEAMEQIRPALRLNSASSESDLLIRDTDPAAVRTLKGYIQDLKRIEAEPVLVPERRPLSPDKVLGRKTRDLPEPTAEAPVQARVQAARARVDAEKAKLQRLIEDRVRAKPERPSPQSARTVAPNLTNDIGGPVATGGVQDQVLAAARSLAQGEIKPGASGRFQMQELHAAYAKMGGDLSMDDLEKAISEFGPEVGITWRGPKRGGGAEVTFGDLSRRPSLAVGPGGVVPGKMDVPAGRAPKGSGSSPKALKGREFAADPEGAMLEVAIRRQREAVEAAKKEFRSARAAHQKGVQFSRLERELDVPEKAAVAPGRGGEALSRQVTRTRREAAQEVAKARSGLRAEQETLEDIRLSIEAGEISGRRATETLEAQRARISEARAVLEGARGDAARVAEELKIRRLDARQRISDIRQAIKDEVEEVASIRRELIGEGKRESQVRAALAKRITEDATSRGDLVAQAIEIRKHQRRYGSIAVNELRDKYPEMYEHMKGQKDRIRVIAMDGEIANAVYGSNGILDRMYAPDNWAQTFRAFDLATQWWKQWTLAFPQTRVRDQVTNFAMLSMAGVKVRRLAESVYKGRGLSRAIRDAMNNDFKALDTFKFVRSDGAELTGRELYERMFGKGMLSGGYYRDEAMIHGMDAAYDAAGTAGSEQFAGGFLNGILPPVGPLKNLPPAGTNPIIKFNHHVADASDGYAKIHGTLAQWLDGSDLEDALQVTNAWMYNPAHGKTLIERQAFSRFMPFYNWMRFAVKNQVKAYFQHPGSLQSWEKLRQAALQARGVDEQEWDDILPDYVTENFGIPDPGFPLWRQSKEGPEFYLLGSYIPIGEIAQIADAIDNFRESDGASALDYVGTRLNPGIKLAIETVANRSFFSGRTIEQFPGEHAEMFGVPMPRHVANFIQNYRLINELDRLNVLSFNDWDEFRLSLGDATPRGQLGTRAELPFAQRALSSAFGILPRGQIVDVEEEARFKRGQLERERSKFKGLLRRRVEEQERPNRKADIETIQAEIAEVMARLRNVNQIAPEPEEMRR